MSEQSTSGDSPADDQEVQPSNRPSPRLIQRMTLDYSTLQDRLQIRGIDVSGTVLVLWLTQRLCNMLVKAVIGILEQSVAPAADPTMALASPNQPRGPTAASNYIAQTRAELSKVPAPTVQLPRDAELAEEALIESIQLKKFKQTYIVNLAWGSQAAELPMIEAELRQFMRAMHNRYRTAGWPLQGLWPDWFSETAHQTYIKSSHIN